jgi:hypothetical protein
MRQRKRRTGKQRNRSDWTGRQPSSKQLQEQQQWIVLLLLLLLRRLVVE